MDSRRFAKYSAQCGIQEPLKRFPIAGSTTSYRRTVWSIALSCLLLLSACGIEDHPEDNPTADSGSDESETDALVNNQSDVELTDDAANDPAIEPDTSTLGPDTTSGVFPPAVSDISDNESVYQNDGYGQIDVIRLDVRTVKNPGNCEAGDYDGCTLMDVQSDVDRQDDFKPRIDVHFKTSDFADDGSVSNAELRQRGGSTRAAEQKSFRIRLDDRDTLWRNERSLLLNKHPFEATRVRNKVAFDLMTGIPNLLSFRTQFTNLWIDDGQGPTDFGLFTHVEAPGGNYLEKRGFSREDRLYKVNLFRFMNEDLINAQVDAEGRPLDKDVFERSLEIESGEDHRPLARMLQDFHDPTLSFDSILDKYFNRNNILTWMAVNFLLNQSDAITQNFLLYNPVNSERFYFVPWDYDGALTPEVEPPAEITSNSDLQRRVFAGYARGIQSDFYARYYRLPGMHTQMVAAATYLRQNHLTDQRISDLAQIASEAVEPFLTRTPDNQFNSNYNESATRQFSDHVADNLEALSTSFSYPLSPELLPPELAQNEWVFTWRPGIDPTGNALSYELQISNGLEFTPDQIVLQVDGIDENAVKAVPLEQFQDITDSFGIIEQRVDPGLLAAGEHFARVIARSSRQPERFWQVSINRLDRDGVSWQGPVAFNNP